MKAKAVESLKKEEILAALDSNAFGLKAHLLELKDHA
jgi:hypothetical protein